MKKIRRWVLSHPGVFYGFWICWCGYWSLANARIALQEMAQMVRQHGSAGSILLATWSAVVTLALLGLLHQNCVWYARVRRISRGEDD